MIDEADIVRLKEIFVTKDSCNETTEEIRKKIEKDSIELAVIQSQLKMIIWILCAVGGGIITMLIKMFFDL